MNTCNRDMTLTYDLQDHNFAFSATTMHTGVGSSTVIGPWPQTVSFILCSNTAGFETACGHPSSFIYPDIDNI